MQSTKVARSHGELGRSVRSGVEELYKSERPLSYLWLFVFLVSFILGLLASCNQSDTRSYAFWSSGDASAITLL